MAITDNALKVDNQNKPIPQVYNSAIDDFVPLVGDENGMNVNVVDIVGYDDVNDKIQVGTARDKFRDEFFSFDTDNSWDVIQTGAGHAISVGGVLNGARYLNINTGTTISTETIIQSQKSFKLPLKAAIGLSLSQRIVNQEFFIELVGVDVNGNVETDTTFPSTNLNDATNAMSFKFSGTSATAGSFGVTRGYGISELVSAAITTTTTAATGTTPNFIPAALYELNLDMEQAIWNSWPIDSLAAPVGVTKRSQNLPDPSKEYKVRIRARNLGTTPTSATDMRVHCIRILDTTRMTVDFSRHMGRTTDIASSLPVYVSGAASLAVTTSSAVVGQAAHDAAVSGSPVRIAGRALAANYTGVASGDVADLVTTTVGALVQKPYSIPDQDWQWTTGTTAISTAVATAMKAAGAAGIRNYCTGIQYQNTNATATLVTIQDGATNIAVFNAPANMVTPAVIDFPTPLRGTAATAMNFNVVTAGASIYVNAQGYQAP